MKYQYIPFPVVGPDRIQAPGGLPRVIIERTAGGCTTSYADKPPTINAPVQAIADAVESAYVLTPKDELPKVTDAGFGAFTVEGLGTLYPQGDRTAAGTRKRAAAWLAVSRHLEAKEKAKAYEEAKAKAVADAMTAAAEAARTARLDELADEWFGADFFSDLGPNKAAAVKEIYRLETKLAHEGNPA